MASVDEVFQQIELTNKLELLMNTILGPIQ